ncbi:NrfD/PsrC family molybdoenzyme membrane anchor subunit [Tsukamurella sp. 1534]|uniref:NrfD/PsrC family molybdoenzyme membrane anchor subunit n=1 Tax=Tsukamurella sp. 1534 TaxID=1151061 RepID=UPI0002E11AFB|nr:NrfD/PsrC family molybdoenzyme membrane anchor subunit [Tsukamurella sp. 1534]
MTHSEFDEVRPPEPPRRRKWRKNPPKNRPGLAGGGDGSREVFMVPDAEFGSYYGKPVVKPPPWEWPVAAYLVLGGVAGGSGVLALGGQLTGRSALRRNARLGALTAVGLGAVALIADLGRPERFINMMRTAKVTSPMSMGSWILSGYGTGIGIAAAAEVDRLTGERLPLGPLRRVLRAVEGPAGFGAAAFGPPLAVYTAVLLSDTAVPTWNEAHRDLPFVFVSSASLASGGLAMVTTPTAETGPARAFAVAGVLGDIAAMKYMESRMDPVLVEPLHHGKPGAMLRWSERLAVAGGLGALLGGGRRPVAVASGLALLGASALTRFGVFEAGLESTHDPKYVIEPQKRRLARRRAAGQTGDSITTAE